MSCLEADEHPMDLTADTWLLILVLVAAFLSFLVSASAGMGGSLLLVPTLSLAFGFREGIALAALLLAANNIFKVIAYRNALPWRAAARIAVLVVIGAAVGAILLVSLPEGLIGVFVVVSLVGTLWAERSGWSPAARVGTPLLAFASGATSGVSGTSGPLKGAAIRNLGLDRAHFVGAASLVSLAGDLTKTGIFAGAGLLDASAGALVIMTVPLMMLGTALGRRLNRSLGERGFAVMFWTVMTGYTIRLVVVLG
jgi:uncharacterized membrane protein YfcA